MSRKPAQLKIALLQNSVSNTAKFRVTPQWEMMRYYRGLMGMAALFNIDFHSPRHAPHREAVQDWLIPAYGVTLP